jgi:signal transduction histidine kinase
MVLVAVLAVALFAGPLAVAASRLYRDQAVGRLTAEAVRAAAELPDQVRSGKAGVPARLSVPRWAEVRLGLYDGGGRRLAGDGPDGSGAAVAVAADGAEHQEVASGDLAVAVPVEVGRRDLVVRAEVPYDTVLARTWATFGGMVALAAVVLGFAAAFSRRRAARIAAPLEELTRAAEALGAGDFTVRVSRSDIAEAAEAGRALEATAVRLGALVQRERSFATDASHQIRTPVTALRLGLEQALLTPADDLAAVIGLALDRIDRVQATVDELTARAADTLAPVQPTDLAAVVRQAAAARWTELARHAGRQVRIQATEGLPPAAATPAVLHQVLDVVVSNALEHGAGTVTVTVRAAPDGGVAVSVSDEGPGFDEAARAAAFRRGDPRARGTGIGLSLARDLAESIGGRLVVSEPGPRPVVALLLPAWPASAAYSEGA